MGIPPPQVTPNDGDDSPFYKNEFAVEIRGCSIRHPKMVVPKIGLPLKYLKSSSFDWDCPLPSSYGSMDPWKPKFMACRSAGACRGMPGPQASSGYSLELQSHDYPASCEVTTWGDSMCDIVGRWDAHR